ncbi:MAG: isomerizing glutamine--fructose-6-phosphate transaminase, partial [Gemmatimonas sp.]
MATPMLIEGLKRLEYRGYDSAGVAIMNGKGVETRRAAGKIARLESVIAASPPHGTLGIAHPRWATHGPPTENNAHPHVSQNGKIAVVHNGIIENATVLKAGLEARGYVFKSDTDTEVLAHLIETAYAGNLEAAVIEALRQVDGTYGIAVISSDEKDKMVAARKGSPLLVGIGEGENFIASDASAILSHTRHVVYLDDGDIAVVTKDGYRVLDLDSVIREKPVTRIEWDLAQIERGGYPHFMLKEIFEQPTTVENTMRGRLILEEGFSKLGGLNISKEDLLAVDNIIITACGTSWHSALIGEMMIEELCRIPVEVEYASEFRYRNPIVTPRTLC